MARWAEYFKQLFTVDPLSGQLQTAGMQTLHADPPIDETTPSIGDVKEAVAKVRGGKAAGMYNISTELLKVGGWRPYPWVSCCLDCCLAFRYHSS